MRREYKGMIYQLTDQPGHPLSFTCDGCEIPEGECSQLSHNECAQPANLHKCCKKVTNEETNGDAD